MTRSVPGQGDAEDRTPEAGQFLRRQRLPMAFRVGVYVCSQPRDKFKILLRVPDASFSREAG